MIRFIFLVVLLTGCAQQPHKQLPVYSIQDWQQLEPLLQAAPTELSYAIYQEVKGRLASTNQVGLKSQTEQYLASQNLLKELLINSQNEFLLVDAKFYQTHKVASGEKASMASSFAQNLAKYLLLPSFACNQPIYARYFQERYQGKTPKISCNEKLPFFVINRYEGGKVLWLSPKRVSAIHLLFAGEGQSMASSFGHVALRLIICPEEGELTEDRCDSNLFEHLVLGYMAHIDEYELDIIKALNGNYKAYLFASPFMDVYRDYAISEFREVYSLPLVLKQQQREQMVKELSEIHWHFSGDYSFFNQNCAGLLQQALKIHLPEVQTDEQLSGNFIRPDNLFAAARKSSLTQGDKLSSLQLAEQQGYYFSSTKPFYNEATVIVQNAMTQPEFTDLDNYLQLNPVHRLESIYKDVDYLARLKVDKHLLGAQLLLEELAFVRSERLLMAEATRYFQQLDNQEKIEKIHAQLNAQQAKLFDNCLLKPVQQITAPVKRLSGIPQAEDIPIIKPISSLDCQSIQGREQLAKLLSIVDIGEQDKKQWQRVLNASQIVQLNQDNIFTLNNL